jgi:hypothetical protein
MKPLKIRKKQEDRLLKRLSYRERRQQEYIRSLIANDPLFSALNGPKL